MSQSQNSGLGFVTLSHEQRATIQKSLVSHVQGDLTGVIVTFENDYRLV